MENSSACYDLQEAPEWALVFHAVCVAMILLASLVGNGLVIILVAKYKRLRRRSTFVSLSVVAVDLIMAVSYHLPILVSVTAKEWPFGDISCDVSAFISNVTLIRWITVASLSVDRFNTVRFPFSYERRSKYVIISMTLFAWIVPMILAVPGKFLAEVTFAHEIPRCRFLCNEDEEVCLVYSTFVFGTVAVVIGAILPTVLYSWLYCHARKLRPSALTLGKLSIQVASGAIVSQPIAQMERNSREIRAIVTFAIIFITSVVTTLPIFTIRILQALSQDMWCKIPIIVQFIIYQVFMSSTVLDPVVIMRDRDFRNCFKDLCCCCRRMSIADVVSKINGTAASMNLKQRKTSCDIPLTDHKNVEHINLQVNSPTDPKHLLHPEQVNLQVDSPTEHKHLLHLEHVNLQVNLMTDHERLLHPEHVNLKGNPTTDKEEETTDV